MYYYYKLTKKNSEKYIEIIYKMLKLKCFLYVNIEARFAL